MDWIDVLSSVGFPIFSVLACGWFIYINVTRDRDESSKRELRLIEANEKLSEALTKVGNTIEETNELNRVLSENNKIFAEQLDEMNESISKILDRLIDK